MIVYALRHGEAETKAQSPEGNDKSRRLTPRGSVQVKIACNFAKKLGAKPSVIFSSPYSRATQSAESAREILNPKCKLKIENCLEPESKPEEIYKLLSGVGRAEEVVLVSHLPVLGDFISDFVSWKDAWINLEMPPGFIMKIGCFNTHPKSGAGTVLWLLPQIKRDFSLREFLPNMS